MAKEIWKDIVELDKNYQISNFGRVKSKSRIFYRSNGRRQLLKDRILKQQKNKKGYCVVTVTQNQKVKSFRVHRLVAKYFCNKQNGKYQVNHINGIKTDNRATNLEWVTQSENMKHAYKIGLLANCCKKSEDAPNAKMTNDTAIKLKEMIEQGIDKATICKHLSITIHMYNSVKYGYSWKHI